MRWLLVVPVLAGCNQDLRVTSATYACGSDAHCLDGWECVADPMLGGSNVCNPVLDDVARIDPTGAGAWNVWSSAQPDGCAITVPDAAQATLGYAFDIDRNEVSVTRFRTWVDAGMPFPCDGLFCSLDPAGPLAEVMLWDPDWNDEVQNATNFDPGTECLAQSPFDYGPITWRHGDESLPMTCVSWYQAAAFCAWDGAKRLPTETEWQYVATGGEQRLYPSGGTAPPATCFDAIFDDNDHCNFPVSIGVAPGDRSKDGVADLSGSVFEWVWDRTAPYPTSSTDYTGPTTGGGEERVRRGGSFINDACHPQLTTSGRDSYNAGSFFNDAGFRCARSVK